MPRETTPPEVLMYCTGTCPYCLMADRLFAKKGISVVNRIRVDLEPERRREMVERAGRTSVPQIFIGEFHVGGYDELSWLDRLGKLDALLEGATDAGEGAGLLSEGSQ
jgi:glutaredoxin 3